MSKEDALRVDGTVVDILPNATFRVKVQTLDVPVLGVISGKMRKNNIRILLGDKVEMEFSPYDLTRGRIVRRK